MLCAARHITRQSDVPKYNVTANDVGRLSTHVYKIYESKSKPEKEVEYYCGTQVSRLQKRQMRNCPDPSSASCPCGSEAWRAKSCQEPAEGKSRCKSRAIGYDRDFCTFAVRYKRLLHELALYEGSHSYRCGPWLVPD